MHFQRETFINNKAFISDEAAAIVSYEIAQQTINIRTYLIDALNKNIEINTTLYSMKKYDYKKIDYDIKELFLNLIEVFEIYNDINKTINILKKEILLIRIKRYIIDHLFN